jgi:hypothetical protein
MPSRTIAEAAAPPARCSRPAPPLDTTDTPSPEQACHSRRPILDPLTPVKRRYAF